MPAPAHPRAVPGRDWARRCTRPPSPPCCRSGCTGTRRSAARGSSADGARGRRTTRSARRIGISRKRVLEPDLHDEERAVAVAEGSRRFDETAVVPALDDVGPVVPASGQERSHALLDSGRRRMDVAEPGRRDVRPKREWQVEHDGPPGRQRRAAASRPPDRSCGRYRARARRRPTVLSGRARPSIPEAGKRSSSHARPARAVESRPRRHRECRAAWAGRGCRPRTEARASAPWWRPAARHRADRWRRSRPADPDASARRDPSGPVVAASRAERPRRTPARSRETPTTCRRGAGRSSRASTRRVAPPERLLDTGRGGDSNSFADEQRKRIVTSA